MPQGPSRRNTLRFPVQQRALLACSGPCLSPDTAGPGWEQGLASGEAGRPVVRGPGPAQEPPLICISPTAADDPMDGASVTPTCGRKSDSPTKPQAASLQFLTEILSFFTNRPPPSQDGRGDSAARTQQLQGSSPARPSRTRATSEAACHRQQDCEGLPGERGLSDRLAGGKETRAGHSNPQPSHPYLALRTSCYHKGPVQTERGGI